jgi:hypothetical protein
MSRFRLGSLLLSTSLLFVTAAAQTPPPATPKPPDLRWTAAQADAWYSHQPWLVGADYIPANAINQLEMWQAATFDPKEIDKELGWAQSIGMNTMRVFLHDLLWQQDPAGFTRRIKIFLAICAKHHIRPIFVLFDSCWDPFPHLGPQHPPTPGIHNSGWVQSPGAAALDDPSQYPRLEAYVHGVISAFAHDRRVLAWDLWNEPDNPNDGSYSAKEPPDKSQRVLVLLPQVFAWARAARPSQPLTSGLWQGDWSSYATLSPTAKAQIDGSDIVSFHNYSGPQNFEQTILELQQFGRPLICTEYMARTTGSTFAAILPIAKRYKVAAINWGLVAGKTQTYLPWDSWQHPYIDHQPAVWHHDIFHADGTPYRPEEVALIRQLTDPGTPANKGTP